MRKTLCVQYTHTHTHTHTHSGGVGWLVGSCLKVDAAAAKEQRSHGHHDLKRISTQRGRGRTMREGGSHPQDRTWVVLSSKTSSLLLSTFSVSHPLFNETFEALQRGSHVRSTYKTIFSVQDQFSNGLCSLSEMLIGSSHSKVQIFLETNNLDRSLIGTEKQYSKNLIS